MCSFKNQHIPTSTSSRDVILSVISTEWSSHESIIVNMLGDASSCKKENIRLRLLRHIIE